MPLKETLLHVMTAPTPVSLWQLRGDLLQSGLPHDASVLAVLDRFYQFLNELAASTSAHEYSRLASLLDIGAMGGVVVGSLLETRTSVAELWQRLLLGGLSESLMVMASRQYIKGAKAEMQGVYRAAAWYLYRELWHLSQQYQPELEAAERRQHIESLLAPVQRDSVHDTAKAVLIGRLFQLLLLAHLHTDAAL
jgi:hypothetical protein